MNKCAHRHWRTHAKQNHIQNHYYWLRFYLSKQNDERHVYLFSMTAWVHEWNACRRYKFFGVHLPFAIFFFAYSVVAAAAALFRLLRFIYAAVQWTRRVLCTVGTATETTEGARAHTVCVACAQTTQCLTLILILCVASLYSVISHDIMYNLSKYWYLLHYNDIIEWNFGGNAFAWGRLVGLLDILPKKRANKKKEEHWLKGPNQLAYGVRGGCCCHCRCCIQNQMKQHHQTSAIYDAPFIGQNQIKYIGNIFGWSISLFFLLFIRSRFHFRPSLYAVRASNEQWAGSRFYRQHPRMGAVRDGVRLFLYFNRNIKMMESICTWIEREAFIYSIGPSVRNVRECWCEWEWCRVDACIGNNLSICICNDWYLYCVHATRWRPTSNRMVRNVSQSVRWRWQRRRHRWRQRW